MSNVEEIKAAIEALPEVDYVRCYNTYGRFNGQGKRL